jgi:integrase
VREAGELWITQGEEDGLERSTLMQYRQHLDYHIAPFIGQLTLVELSPGKVQDFRSRLFNAGRSRAMVKRAIGSLGAILATAMVNSRVGRNVVRDQARANRRQARLDRRHKKTLEVGVDLPTKEEIRRLVAAAQGRWRALVLTAIFTGLRASELRGLRWRDVDLDRTNLTIRQRADRWNTIGPTKSASGRRDVPLAPIVVNTLKEWRLACPKGELDLVFPNRKGLVLTLTDIHRLGLTRLAVVTGLTDEEGKPKYGLQALRHAAASLFIEQGFGPKRIQALMGHSSIQVTFDTYGHLFPSQSEDQAALRQLQARLLDPAGA